MRMNEAQYHNRLINKIRDLLPGCIILRNDPRFMQGVPDIIILFRDKWAMLEIKIADKAGVRPNQQYYIDLLNEMSFASFINPENEGMVLDDLQQSFGVSWETCIP